MTQRELAREFGVTGAAIAQWENGQRPIPGPVERLVSLYESEFSPITTATSERAAGFAEGVAYRLRRTSSSVESILWFGLSRVVSPGSLGARVRLAAIRNYVSALGELRGLSMKLGQMLGYMSFLLPEDERRALSELTATARPAPYHQVVTTLLEELGALPNELFRDWNPQPLAVASIGQVHEALTREGERVAVKVQHARIVRAIVSDLAQLGTLDRLYSLIFRAQAPGVFHREIGERVLEECDYLVEAKNQCDFREAVGDRTDVAIPKVFPALSSRRVLTSELAEGRSLEEFAKTASPAERDAAATSLWSFFWTCCLRHGLYHTDPHPGNFVFGDGQVTVLDFGRVKRFSPTFLKHWKRFFRAMLERDREGVLHAFVDMGSLPSVEKYDLDYGYKSLVGSFLPIVAEEQPFLFTPEYVRRSWRLFVLDNVNLPFTHFTPDMVFLHQIQYGLSALMTHLSARVPCRDIFLDLVYEPDEPRPPPFTRGELRLLGL